MASANIIADVTVGVMPLTVNFLADVTSGEPYQYEWEFGDGETYTDNDPGAVHTYNTYGVHTVVLKLYSGTGIDYIRMFNLIKIAKLDYTVDAQEGYIPFTVKFTNTSVAPFGLALSDWEWDFGDSSPVSSDVSPQHEYAVEGNFNVTLSANLS